MNRRFRGDRGTATVVLLLGLVGVVGFFGWMTLDLWATAAERRELAAAADQAAQAGAAALDTNTWRASGIRQLDPARAEELALHALSQHDLGPLTDASVTATTEQVVVMLEAEVTSWLITIFRVDDGAVPVRVTAIGTPGEDTP